MTYLDLRETGASLVALVLLAGMASLGSKAKTDSLVFREKRVTGDYQGYLETRGYRAHLGLLGWMACLAQRVSKETRETEVSLVYQARREPRESLVFLGLTDCSDLLEMMDFLD